MRTSIRNVLLLVWGLALLATGCAGDDDAPAVEPLLGDGKADVVDHVTLHGALGFDDAGAVTGSFTEDLDFQGYTLAVRPGAVVALEVTQAGSSKALDTTLFVYGPADAAGGYGTKAVAFDDDAGWGRLSKLTSVPLDAGESWLVVVGTQDGKGRGNYRLQASCLSGECGPVPAPTACRAELAAAIRACVDDRLADPDYDSTVVSRLDLVAECSDPEIVAPAWDTLCATTEAPAELCGLTMEQITLTVLPVCRHALENEVLDQTCVFGLWYGDLWRRPGAVVVLSKRTLTTPDGLSDLDRAQIVAAVHETAYSDVTTAEEAFAAVDQGEVNVTDLWDASNRRAFRVVEVGAGDNSFGLYFEAGTTTVVARDHDSDVLDCTVTWGPERRACQADAQCAAGLHCTGISSELPRGACIDTAADTDPATGAECSASTPCPTGLVCAGEPTNGAGLCVPAWMRGAFVTEPALPIPDGDPAGAEAAVLVYGLATVDVDVQLDLVVSHPRPADLRVSLVNPAGTEVVLFDHTGTGAELYLDHAPVKGFPGDEVVNGVWRLRAIDSKTGEAGGLGRFGLTITSRWD